jgi:transposase
MQTSLIGLEACSGAHFLGRAFRQQGHDVRLIPAQFVKRREILKELELIVCGCVMIFNASMDEDEVQVELARRWVRTAGPAVSSSTNWKKDAAMDKRIFFGDESNMAAKL